MGPDDAENSHIGKVASKRDAAGRTPSSMELEEALRRCEQLLRDVDGGRRRIALTRAVSIGLAAVVIQAVVLFAIGFRDSVRGWVVAAVVAAAVIVVIESLAQWMAFQLREQVRRDELIMVDVIGMQREIFPLLAREEKWSQARLFLTQKRLERFPIEAESVPDRRARDGL
jgi:hypothetical protein